VDPTKYAGLLSGIRTVIAEEAAVGLVKGWAPTFIGYSLQGAGKFGLYEVFKDLYSTALGEDGSYRHRAIVYAAASGSAEFFADILLCPMEMVKVRTRQSATTPGSWQVHTHTRVDIMVGKPNRSSCSSFRIRTPAHWISLGEDANVQTGDLPHRFRARASRNACKCSRNSVPLRELGAAVGPTK
jgi:Mitochondrial carrier protein